MARLAALQAAARQIFEAAIAAGDAAALTRAALRVEEGRLLVGSRGSPGAREIALDAVRRVVVVGAGKASGAMAEAVEAVLGERVATGLVAVKEARGVSTQRIRLVEAGHPLPDARGQTAGEEILELAGAATAEDLVLCLISGGGSALTPQPVPGLALAEKQTVTRLLLEAGATIHELNAVRKHLSRLKGGQLARAAAPATVISLLLSDVIGDSLDVIASGPTAADPSTFGDALAVLDRLELRARVPAAARALLEAGARGAAPETPKPGDPAFERVANVVIGNNELIVSAAGAAARRLGFLPVLLTRSVQGEAREVARVFGAVIDEVVRSGRPVAHPCCLILAGETTVTVRGRGLGGRAQELALALVRGLAAHADADPAPRVVVLAAGTDGSDGPTRAAGAMVDGTSAARARSRGLDARASLAANDAYHFFHALDDLIVTGPTRTNLMDLYLALIE